MSIKKTPIGVLGAGSWGTALALHLARNDNAVRLWGHRPEHVHALALQRENKRYLDGHVFPDNLDVYSDLAKCLTGVKDVLIVVPSPVIHELLLSLKAVVTEDIRIAWATKGMEPHSHCLISSLIVREFSDAIPLVVISGPSFAQEVAEGLATAVSVAGNDEAWLNDWVTRLHSDTFRAYTNSDLIGVQLCGVVKNVLAIAVGLADGLGAGANARAALITRGMAEMGRLCHVMGAKAETLLSLAGIGDVVLTCTDNQSRNRRFGLGLGQGKRMETIYEDIGQEIEGAHNVAQVYALAQQHHIDMPITEQIYLLLQQRVDISELIPNLMARDPSLEN